MRTITFGLSLVFIFTIPWEGVIRFAGLGTAAKFIGLALAACWVITIVITGRLRKPGPFQIAVYPFVLWTALSVFWSANPDATIGQVMTWAQLLVLVFILWDLYTTRAAVMAGLQAYILGAYVAFGSAIANYFSGEAFYSHYDRFSSGETNPDGFGFILVLGLPVAWYLASSKSTTKIGILLKLVNYAYVPAGLVGISLSGTRTALVAAIPAMAFGLASLSRVRLWIRVAIFILFTVAVLILLPQIQSLRSFQRFSTVGTELTEGDLNNRTNNWRQGLAAFAEQPLTGVGGNMYRTVNSWGKVAHNSFLSVLVELGLIGFALFGIILTMAFFQAWRQPKWESRFWLALLAVWASGAFTLTWEDRKSTWLFLSLIVASAALTRQGDKAERLVQPQKSMGQWMRQAPWNKPLPRKKMSYLVD